MGQLRGVRRGDGAAGLILLGLDPGLGTTGWGVIVVEGNRLGHLGNGQIRTKAAEPLVQRLGYIAEQVNEVLIAFNVAGAGVEEVFVNENGQSTLKLAQARGAALSALGLKALPVAEYAPRLVKQAVVGTGTADKAQMHAMVTRLLPGAKPAGPDAADALAVAICHAHHLSTARRLRTEP